MRVLGLLFFLIPLFSLGSFGQQISDTIRVTVKEFAVNSKETNAVSPFGAMSGKKLSDLLSYAFFNNGIIKLNTDEKLASDFVINGNAEFFGDEFYLSTSITGPSMKTTQGPVAGGKNRELLKAIDDLNARITTSILSSWHETKNSNVVALITKKQNSVTDQQKDLLYEILNSSPGYSNWAYWKWYDFLAYTDSAKAIGSQVDAIVELNFSTDKSGTIIIPRITDKNRTNYVYIPPSVLNRYTSIFQDENADIALNLSNDINETILKISPSGNIDNESIINFLAKIRSSNNDSSMNLLMAAQEVDKTSNHLVIARERYRQKRMLEAYVFADKVAKRNSGSKDSDYFEALLLKGEILYSKEKFFDALNAFRQIYKDNPNYYNPNFGYIETYLGKTTYAFAAKDSVRHAEIILSKMLDKGQGTATQKAEGYYYYARALKKNAKYKEAISWYKNVISLNPTFKDVTKTELFDCYYKWGWSNFSQRNYREAANIFLEARQIKSDDFGTNKHLIESLYILKEFDQADSLLEQCKLLDMSYYEWAIVVRNMFNESMQKNQESDAILYANKTLALVGKFLQKKPDHKWAQWLRANTLININNYEDGIPLLRQVFERDTTDIGFRLDLAEGYLMSGQAEKSDQLINAFVLKNLTSEEDKSSGNLLIATFLKYVTSIVLFDEGRTSETAFKKYENQFHKISQKHIKSVNWSLFAFNRWVQKYNNSGKPQIMNAIDQFTKASQSQNKE